MAPSAPCRRGRWGPTTTAPPAAAPPASPWWWGRAAPRRRAEWRAGGERHRIVPGAVARGFAPRLRGRQARACALGSEPVPLGLAGWFGPTSRAVSERRPNRGHLGTYRDGSLPSLSAEGPSINLDYLSRVDLGIIIVVWGS